MEIKNLGKKEYCYVMKTNENKEKYFVKFENLEEYIKQKKDFTTEDLLREGYLIEESNFLNKINDESYNKYYPLEKKDYENIKKEYDINNNIKDFVYSLITKEKEELSKKIYQTKANPNIARLTLESKLNELSYSIKYDIVYSLIKENSNTLTRAEDNSNTNNYSYNMSNYPLNEKSDRSGNIQNINDIKLMSDLLEKHHLDKEEPLCIDIKNEMQKNRLNIDKIVKIFTIDYYKKYEAIKGIGFFNFDETLSKNEELIKKSISFINDYIETVYQIEFDNLIKNANEEQIETIEKILEIKIDEDMKDEKIDNFNRKIFETNDKEILNVFSEKLYYILNKKNENVINDKFITQNFLYLPQTLKDDLKVELSDKTIDFLKNALNVRNYYLDGYEDFSDNTKSINNILLKTEIGDKKGLLNVDFISTEFKIIDDEGTSSNLYFHKLKDNQTLIKYEPFYSFKNEKIIELMSENELFKNLINLEEGICSVKGICEDGKEETFIRFLLKPTQEEINANEDYKGQQILIPEDKMIEYYNQFTKENIVLESKEQINETKNNSNDIPNSIKANIASNKKSILNLLNEHLYELGFDKNNCSIELNSDFTKVDLTLDNIYPINLSFKGQLNSYQEISKEINNIVDGYLYDCIRDNLKNLYEPEERDEYPEEIETMFNLVICKELEDNNLSGIYELTKNQQYIEAIQEEYEQSKEVIIELE